MKSSRVPSLLGLLLRPSTTTQTATPFLSAQTRLAHTKDEAKPPRVPSPIPFVPDVQTFLTLIGRGLKQHADKIPTWEALFTLNTEQLRELGVEPPRTRRYLLRWRQRFREGKFGPGGDLKYVQDGKAYLGVLETEKSPILTLRHAVNLPAEKKPEEVPRKELARVKGYKVKGLCNIAGPYALPAGPGKALIKVTEGMWEDRRGHKVDGGERRRAEVRFRRGIAERKAMREKMGY
ncbi:hypothetical protein OQA88_6845 [Cercophora sp. LCS_1]